MIKSDTFILDNGLRIVFCQDNSKKASYAELYTNFGGRTEGFIYNDKEYHITSGLAHLMEHCLIDNSVYGNAFDSFQTNYVSFNGFTTFNHTSFYINDILDFESNLVKLINIVNNPKFSKESIETSKKAVIEEIRRSKDNRFRNISLANKKCLYNNLTKIDNLGTEEEVSSITYEEMKLCHNLFYQPFNQTLALSGNFDIEKIKKLIMDAYEKINKPIITYEEIKIEESKTIAKKEEIIIDSENEEYCNVLFKICIDDFTPYELVKLSFYMEFFLRSNFKDGSDLYNYMIDNKYSVYSIDVNTRIENNYEYIEIGCFTNHIKEFTTYVLDIIDKKPFNEEEFNIWFNRNIISILMREEHPGKMIGPFVDNILTFKYLKNDTIEDVTSLNALEYKTFMNRLDFSNYAIVTRLNKKYKE